MKRSRRWAPSASRITSSWRRSLRASAREAGGGGGGWGGARRRGVGGGVGDGVGALGGGGGAGVRMLPGPRRAEDRLGHEGGQQPAALGNRLDRVLEGDQLVRALERVAEGQVQLVLPRRDLVMAGLDGDSEAAECPDDLLPHVAADVDGMVGVAGAGIAPRSNAARGGGRS